MEQQNNRRSFLKTTAAGLASATVVGGSMNSFASSLKNIEPEMSPAFTEFKAIDFEKVKPSLLQWPSEKAVKEHLKLYNGYVRKSNEILGMLKLLDRDPKKANQVYSEIRELKVEYSFAVGGVKNHEIYFDSLGSIGGKLSGKVAELLVRDFGSIEACV
jgi:Fe-Mn family superoxide dismutase